MNDDDKQYTIKPLVWVEEEGDFIYETPFGKYSVYQLPISGKWVVLGFDNLLIRLHEGIAADAKLHAEKDYYNRLAECLNEVTP